MIPFVDLKARYEPIRDEMNAAVPRVLGSAQFVLGPEVEVFEPEFCGLLRRA
ncbi:MAG TPA: hypothetical protein VK421_14140 [Pyrinomonadaceae bacterium]|nr:hypothetical protein [Pyrinomonadaceae bacterium]